MQCKGNLVCFKRHGLETVPGCLGEGISGKDYCTDPYVAKATTLSQENSLTYVGENGPFSLCQGDCDRDSQVSLQDSNYCVT